MKAIKYKLRSITLLVVALTAHAQNSESNKVYGNPADGRYLLTYTPEGAVPNTSHTEFQAGTDRCYYRSSANAGSLVIPLQLPDKHRIQGVRYEYIDEVVNSSEYIEMKLFTFDHLGNFINQVSIQSSGYLGLDSEFVAVSPPIDVHNALYSYAIELSDTSNVSTTDLQHCSVSLSMTSVPAP